MSKELLILCRSLYLSNTRPKKSPLLVLYQTRTIFSPKCHFTKHGKCAGRSLSSTSVRREHEDVPLQNVATKPPPTHGNVDLPESTITAPERAIFDRIFKSLVNTHTPHSSPSDDLYGETTEDILSQDVTLESIFDSAIRSIKERPRRSPAGPNLAEQQYEQSRSGVVQPNEQIHVARRHRFPPSLQRSLELAHEAVRTRAVYRRWRPEEFSEKEDAGVEVGEPVDEYERLVQQARSEDMQRVTVLLQAAASDVEIWRILEKEVFTRIEALSALLKKEEKAKKAAAVKSKGRPPKNTQSPNIVNEINVLTSAALPEAEDSQESELRCREDGGQGRSAAPESELTQPSPAITPDLTPSATVPHPLSILQTNYAPHLLTALRLLRTDNPASPYVPSLLSTLKCLGPISCVLGASTALYNEFLYIRWVHYRDLHGCADLVTEMVGQGIGTDGLTHAVFIDAARSRRRARRIRAKGGGHEGIEAGWWLLQGVVSGWERWKVADDEARRALEEERARVRMDILEREDEDQDSDEGAEETKRGGRDSSGGGGEEEYPGVDVALLEDFPSERGAVPRAA